MGSNNSHTKVFVVTHKTELPNLPARYQPIFVGPTSKQDQIPTWWSTDASADSIHAKNPFYCELTALYWIWKNDDSEFVGLTHYRRFFADNDGSLPSPERLAEILGSHDVIISKKEYLGGSTVAKHYDHHHVSSDLAVLNDVIARTCPEFLGDLEKTFDSYQLSPYNMIFCRREFLDSYCSWLFKVLRRCERPINAATGRSAYQSRVFGFLAERLLNVFVSHRQCDAVQLPIWSPDAAVVKCAESGYQPCETLKCPSFQEIIKPLTGEFFNAAYYAQRYGDIQRSIGDNEQEMRNHFMTFGLRERRQASAEFFISDFMLQQPAFRYQHRDDLPAYVHEYASLVESGKLEHLPHNLKFGLTELDEIDYSAVYDYAYYTSTYHDVPDDEFDSTIALRHFVEVGMAEGRQGSLKYVPEKLPADRHANYRKGYHAQMMRGTLPIARIKLALKLKQKNSSL